MMNQFCDRLPLIEGIRQETIKLRTPFEYMARRFSGENGTVVLLSGTDLDCSRYHLLAVRPWLVFSGKGKQYSICVNDMTYTGEGDSLSVLDELISRFSIPVEAAFKPVSSGFFGYFSYDFKNEIETLPQTCVGPDLPDFYLQIPSVVIVQDKVENKTTLSIPLVRGLEKKTSADAHYRKIRQAFFNDVDLSGDGNCDVIDEFSIDRAGFRSNFSKTSYMETVDACIEYIKAGDIYQVNLSQQFEAGFKGDPYALFLALYQKNPAPFFAYVNAGNHHIVSTSPERFIKRDGRYLETRPIKGTIQRGNTPAEDETLRQALSTSTKDAAELSMIVDLMRNDLGRVAAGGSVVVREHKRLEPYDNVYHLVSIVEAELADGKTSADLIRATFPGGSITGCPKIRSMEIIDELEPVKRHVYTGSIGYISFHETLDLSIAIRTATVFDGSIRFSVGGGIVYDSDPLKEYEETLHKGRTLLDTLEMSGKNQESPQQYAWVNGRMIPEDEAMVPANGPGFQYGAGLFETLKVVSGKPINLDAHIQRFNRGWQILFNRTVPDITWADVIGRLIEINRLNNTTAVVKLIGALGAGASDSSSNFFTVFARPYVHRLEKIKKSGIDLITYPYPRQTPLADYKTLNYLYCFLAGRHAGEHQGDEALILNPDRSISETNTCNILVMEDDIVWIPKSDHVLPGVSLASAVEVLIESGYKVKTKRMFHEDLFDSEGVILTNALIGAVPALSLDQKPLRQLPEICQLINGYYPQVS